MSSLDTAAFTQVADTDVGDGDGDGDSAALYVVHAVDRVDERVAGHAGFAYRSPPQGVEDALALARLLLGGPIDEPHEPHEPRRWTRPIAGGRRTVTLTRADPAR